MHGIQIRKLDVDTFVGQVKLFQSSIENWKESLQLHGNILSPKLQQRMDATNHVINLLTDEESELEGNILIVKTIENRPVGVMVIEAQEGEPPFVFRVVAHPDSPRTGTELLEHAVNLSYKQGYGGALQLMPLNDNSVSFFERLGFKLDEDGDYMELNPSDCPTVWHKDPKTDSWLLARPMKG